MATVPSSSKKAINPAAALFFLFFFCATLPVFGQEFKYEAAIDMRQIDEKAQVLFATANYTSEDIPLQFRIQLSLQGKGIQAADTLYGQFLAKAQDWTEINRFEINFGAQDHLLILLDIFDNDGNLVAESRLEEGSVRPSKKQENLEHASDIEIDGLVVPKAVTRAGHDFYTYFGRHFTPPDGSYGYEILIKEQPPRGRSVVLEVHINGKLVGARSLLPGATQLDDFAKAMAEFCFGYLLRGQHRLTREDEVIDDPNDIQQF